MCEDMQSQLPDYLEDTGFSFSVINIDSNPELTELYGNLVPVLKAGDIEICHYFLDVKALQQYMSEIGNPLN